MDGSGFHRNGGVLDTCGAADLSGSVHPSLTSCNNEVIVQELCESRGGRPGLSVLTSLLVSVDVKIY